MELRLLGWQYENIRGGLHNVAISLESGADRWTLIQMPNGTGKTTTMSLLRATFSGESLSPQFVRDLRASDEAETGLFEVRLSIDSKPYRLQLRLNYVDGTCQYWTARSEIRAGGLEEGLLLPHDLRRLFTTDFTRLFIFDGELAKEIRAVGKDRAATAIRTLYRLDRFDALNVQVKRLVEERQQRAAAISTATERRGVTRWKRAYEAAAERKACLAQEQSRLVKHRKTLESASEHLAVQINNRIVQDSTLKTRKEALDVERETIDRRIFDLAAQGMAVLRAPARIHPRILNRLRALGGKLTELKLPKTISAEFFHELAAQPDCVCGRPITAPVRKAILDRSNMYLAEDQILVINKMKLALRESSADATEFTTVSTALHGALRDLRNNKRAQDRLELERVESGDLELERLRSEKQRVERDLEDTGTALEKLTTRDSTRQRELGVTDQTNLPLCEAEVKRCHDKLATATHTHRFVLQAERVQELVSAASALALDRLRERVRMATNEKLAQLVPSEALRVARISGALELQAGRVATKGGVSEGQSLAVAYAFLTSLLSEAPYRLPFIVDSPAVSLDVQVRREVGELIPGLFDQMIMFVISSEREGFADAFYERPNARYITLWRSSEDVAEVREGLSFFRTFHQLEEVA